MSALSDFVGIERIPEISGVFALLALGAWVAAVIMERRMHWYRQPGVSYKDVRPAQAPPLRIGAGWSEPQETQPGQFFKGSIDEVAIYDRTFTLADVSAHFALGSVP